MFTFEDPKESHYWGGSILTFFLVRLILLLLHSTTSQMVIFRNTFQASPLLCYGSERFKIENDPFFTYPIEIT